MQRTIVIGTFLALSLASGSSAEEKAIRSEVSKRNATVGDVVAAPPSDRRVDHAIVRTIAAESPRTSAFSYPKGLSMDAERLFERLGQYPSHCVPMTSDTTYDLAYACYIRGLYDDAIVFADHGIALRDDARLELIKGVCQMHLGRCDEAEATVTQYLNAVNNKNLIGLTVARERLSGPMRVRFDQIQKHILSMAAAR
jgi:hypothetical protein